VFRGDSSNASDLLFTVKRSTLLQLRTELEVFLAGNNSAAGHIMLAASATGLS
jgi:hypothetical protein